MPNYDRFVQNYNLTLSAQQKEAVTSIDGPVLLLAVPGSGKTTVLVSRHGYMILENGISPKDILVLTYTNAATTDMSERFVSFFGEECARGLQFRTINGVCSSICNQAARFFGQSPFELVEDTNKIIGQLLKDITGEFPTEYDVKTVAQEICYIKNMMLGDEEIKKLEKDFPLLEVYNAYKAFLKQRRMMDYDDQLVYAYIYLTKRSEIREYWQSQFKYICVDEAQDTSKIQHEIIKILAGKADNLFMVGDEDQSIYGFRAAFPEALLQFEEDHKNARILLMERNFRSSKSIVSMADKFINKNISRHEKKMVASRENGETVSCIDIRERSEQYDFLLNIAKNCDQQTAILYRDNESSLPIIDLFERSGIKYRITGNAKDYVFFSHRTVLDIRCIMKFALNPSDEASFMQIYYKIKPAVKKEIAQKICDYAQLNGLSIIDAAICMAEAQSEGRKLAAAYRFLKKDLNEIRTARPFYAIETIKDKLGYTDYLRRANISDGRLFILQRIAANTRTVKDFLNRLDDLTLIVKNRQNVPDAHIILSTFHSSKGLEYDCVYIVDAIDGVFPEEATDVSSIGKLPKSKLKIYEEDRRLFYVAMTRAKERLNIFSMTNSSFCNEIFEKKPAKKAYSSNTASTDALRFPKTKVAKPRKRSQSPEYRQFVNSLKTGQKVVHKFEGPGTICVIEDDYITINLERKGITTYSAAVLFENNLLE